MKNINLKLEETEKMKLGDNDPIETSKAIITNSILAFQAQSKGMNISQQRDAIKVIDAIEDADKILSLEDAQYIFLKNIMKNVQWGGSIRPFVAVCDLVENPIPDKE